MSLQYDREVEYLEMEYAEGRMTSKEFNHELLELNRSFQAAVEERAREEYDRIMDQGW